MTYSDAWIEAGNDKAFAAFLNQSPRFRFLPSPPHPYWINHVREWAHRKGLPVHYPDDSGIVIRVPVSKERLLEFLSEIFGDEEQSSLREYIETNCRDDCTYAIGADEF